jgi:hypothetical protein
MKKYPNFKKISRKKAIRQIGYAALTTTTMFFLQTKRAFATGTNGFNNSAPSPETNQIPDGSE